MLTIGINGAKGVGKTTLIDRLCLELEDEFSVGVLPNFTAVPIATAERQNSAYEDKRDTLFSGRAAVRSEFSDHILFVEGNVTQYGQWASAAVNDLIHVVDLDQSNIGDTSNSEFIGHAGLLVANKLDLLNLTTPLFIEISLQAQIKRGLQPTVFSSMHTGFGLDQIVVYLKNRFVLNRMISKSKRR